MTLYLHAGPTKTASTLGQILFASSDTSGASDSGACLYLPVGRAVRGGVGRVHHPVALALQTPDTPAAQALMAEIEDCLARARASAQDVLISSEMLPPDPQAYLPLQGMAARHGHALRMVFVCRDPVARINSMYTQDIKTGEILKTGQTGIGQTGTGQTGTGQTGTGQTGTGQTGMGQTGMGQTGQIVRTWQTVDTSIEAYVAATLASPEALATLRPCTVLRPGFAALGAGFDLLPYHATGMEPLYRQFCARLGLNITAARPDEARVNAGPSAAAIRLLREGVVAPDAPNLYGVLQQADRTLSQPAYFGMTPALAARIKATLADEMATLRTAPLLLGVWQDEGAAGETAEETAEKTAEKTAEEAALHDETTVTDYESYKRLVLDLARQEAEKAAAWAHRTAHPAKPRMPDPQ